MGTPANYPRDPTPDIELYTTSHISDIIFNQLQTNVSIKEKMLHSIISKGQISLDLRSSVTVGLDPFLCEVDYQEFEMFRRFILRKEKKRGYYKKLLLKEKKK